MLSTVGTLLSEPRILNQIATRRIELILRPWCLVDEEVDARCDNGTKDKGPKIDIGCFQVVYLIKI